MQENIFPIKITLTNNNVQHENFRQGLRQGLTFVYRQLFVLVLLHSICVGISSRWHYKLYICNQISRKTKDFKSYSYFRINQNKCAVISKLTPILSLVQTSTSTEFLVEYWWESGKPFFFSAHSLCMRNFLRLQNLTKNMQRELKTLYSSSFLL